MRSFIHWAAEAKRMCLIWDMGDAVSQTEGKPPPPESFSKIQQPGALQHSMIRMGGQNHASHWWCKLLPQNVWCCWYFACVREPFHRTVRNVAYRGRQKVMVHTGTMPVGLLARSSCQILWHVSGRSHALPEAMPLCIYVALFMSASMWTWTARRVRCWTTPDSPWRWKEAADMKPIEMAFCFGQTLTTVQK